MAVQTLVIKVGSDISQALSGLNRISTKTIKLGRDIKRTGGMLTRNLTAPLVGMGAAAVGAAVRSGNMADALLDLEQQTGLSTSTLQEFRRVTAVAGIDTDALATAAQKLNTRIKATGDESLETKNAFALLGVSTRDSQGQLRDMDQLMPEIITKLSGMANETERNSLATQIFGRGATEMLPVLGLTAEGFEAAREEAREMGLVLSRDTLDAANRFRVTWDTLKQSLGAVANELGVAVIPHIEGLAEVITNQVLPAGRKVVRWVGDLNPTLVQASAAFAGVTAAIGPVMLAVGGLITVFGAALAPAAAVAAGLGTLAFVATVVVKNWDVMKLRFTLVWAAIKDATFSAISGILGGLEKLTGFIPLLGDKVSDMRREFDLWADESMAKSGRRMVELEQQISAGARATDGMVTSLEGMDLGLGNVTDSLATATAAQAEFNRVLNERPDTLAPTSRREDESLLPGFDSMPEKLVTIEQGLANVEERGNEALGTLTQAAQSTVSQGVDALVNGITGAGQSFQEFAGQAVAQLTRVITKLLIMKALTALFPGLGSLAGGGGGLLGLANGGVVARNRPRLVGERGPELFVPSSGGRVHSNRDTKSMVGGGGFNVEAALAVMGAPARELTPDAMAERSYWKEFLRAGIENDNFRAG